MIRTPRRSLRAMMIAVAVAAVVSRWPLMSLIMFGLCGGALIGGALAWHRSVATLIASATLGGIFTCVGGAAVMAVDLGALADGRLAWGILLSIPDRWLLTYPWLVGAGVGCSIGIWMANIRSLVRERRLRRLREDQAALDERPALDAADPT